MSDLIRVQINHSITDQYVHNVELILRAGDRAVHSRVKCFRLLYSSAFEERLRWYFEDSLANPHSSARAWAEQIQTELVDFGERLFKAVHSTEEAVECWAIVRDQLHRTQFEITSSSPVGFALPWECMRDPKSGIFPGLESRAFVRCVTSKQQWTSRSLPAKLRVLLVISRPLGEADVPFRAVAREILELATRSGLHIEVLRPATLDEFEKVLKYAKASGRPFDVVHFDGHGSYEDIIATTSARPSVLQKGYILFESSKPSTYVQPADGALIGSLVSKYDVPFLILNACRSAHAAVQDAPGNVVEHKQSVLAFPSFAFEAVSSGVKGVIAARHNLSVNTAVTLIHSVYEQLVAGSSLAESVNHARQKLASSISDRGAVQDWLIPLVFENTPEHHLPVGELSVESEVSKRETELLMIPRGTRFSDGPVFGQDTALLAIDRAFAKSSVLVLHGAAGLGKTTVACEFARWYRATGGISGPIVFTKFTNRVDPNELFGQVIEELGSHGSQYNAEGNSYTEQLLGLLRTESFLWIWDGIDNLFRGIEDANGAVLEGVSTILNELRVKHPAKLLITARGSLIQAKFNLDSHLVNPLPKKEMIDLVGATNGNEWLPIVECADGNPLTLKALLAQCIAEGRTSMTDIMSFCEAIERGEEVINHVCDETQELCVLCSLDQGFPTFLTENQVTVVALLHLFRKFIHLGTLLTMVVEHPNATVIDVGITEVAPTEFILTACADGGLLEKWSATNYRPHPVLHVYLAKLFKQHFDDERPLDAFIDTMVHRSLGYQEKLFEGDTTMVYGMFWEHQNTFAARSLAIQRERWREALYLTISLHTTFHNLNHPDNDIHLFTELKPHFVDSVSGDPIPGYEVEWAIIVKSEAQVAAEKGQLDQAAELLRIQIDLLRPNLDLNPDRSPMSERLIGIMADCMRLLGEIYFRQERAAEAFELLEESLAIAKSLNDNSNQLTLLSQTLASVRQDRGP